MKKNLLKSKIGGFTLVELMVVVGIVALLTGMLTANFTKSRAKARDAKRISDLGQLQLSLELYFDRCNLYPDKKAIPDSSFFMVDPDSACTTPSGASITMSNFMSTIPRPPIQAGQTEYQYSVDGARTNYILMADLEGYNEALSDDIDGNVLTVICDSNGVDERRYCLGPN